MKAKISLVLQVLVYLLILLLITNCGSSKAKKARELIELKLFDQAIEMLSGEIKVNAQNPDLYYELGNAYWCRALELYIKTNNDDALEQDYKEIVKSYENAVKIKPEFVSAIYKLGMICLLDDYEEGIKHLNKVIELEPGHIGANTYLGYTYNNMYGEENIAKSYKFMQKSLDVEPVGKKWEKLDSFTLSDTSKTGTFIVVSEKAPIFSDETGKEIGELKQYSTKEFFEKDIEKYYFDTISYTDKVGWSATTPKNWKIKSKYRDWWEWQALVFDKLPPNSKENRVNWSAYIKWCRSKFPFHILDRDEIRTAKYTGHSEKQIRGWGSSRSYLYYRTFYEVKYKRKLHNKSWIKKEFVELGTGNIRDDERRIFHINERRYWNDDLKHNVLTGLISKGMTIYMLEASLGRLNRKLTSHPNGDDIIEIWYKDNTEFTFNNGRLLEWSEKE